MFLKTFCFALFATCVLSRHVPRYSELDEEDQQLFRAAYETPNYNQYEYEEDEDLPPGKLDLFKDSLWAVKAKLKELKAFNKAMVANLLATKLKVKELVAHSMLVKKHHHLEGDKKKPAYQVPSTYPQYEAHYAPQYAEPQYAPQYAEPQYPEPQYAPHHVHDPYYGH